ncbi:hypothetical protein DB31_8926 [Hyalangium minutum]|uniref:Uncharacterized protein n=1 Tax=Hyalangium minutum TaxID=394096 RepID=A0A085WG99_9BACT|nr:hypothetical protein DB31_8926 [Hyalangium minutum]
MCSLVIAWIHFSVLLLPSQVRTVRGGPGRGKEGGLDNRVKSGHASRAAMPSADFPPFLEARKHDRFPANSPSACSLGRTSA